MSPSQDTPTLRELQQWMSTLIVGGQQSADAHATGKLEALILAPRSGSSGERLHVYVAGYPARALEALAETFPAVAHVVGEGAFRALVQRYVDAIPLRSYNLNDAGAALPQFLADDVLTTTLPFLPDLAQLEWQVAQAFHADDEPALEPATLADWTPAQWEHAVLRFQPWVGLVVSKWPIREIWQCRTMAVEDIDVDLRNRPDRVLVRRAKHAVECESIDPAEAAALAALIEGHALGKVLASLVAEDDPNSVFRWFARWTALRMITGCLAVSASGT